MPVVSVCLSTATPPSAAQSLRPGNGAIPYDGGVAFRTWAPHASSVTVAGDFNGWNPAGIALERDAREGWWSIEVPGAAPGQQFKFRVNNAWRRDPYSLEIANHGSRNSVIHDLASFDWGGVAHRLPPSNELVLYELHVGSFYDPDPYTMPRGTLATLREKIDYLDGLGVNVLQLMPVTEFPTETSWGYNQSYPYAIESSYGSPREFQELVKACHEKGISVFVDVVHNHWGGDSSDWSLWRYDGWSENDTGGIFFQGEHPFLHTPWGPRPDYRRPEVRSYIVDNFRMWKRDYRVDGFRWDAPKYILYTDKEQSLAVPDGQKVFDDVLPAIAQEYPGTFQIAEDIENVRGFDSYWDLGFQYDIQSIMSHHDDNGRDMGKLAWMINKNPARILFSETHDSTGELNPWAVRFPRAVDYENPEGFYARKRSALAAAFVLTAPGIPMLWQGQEFLETELFSDTRTRDWSRRERFAHVTEFYRDLIRLRRNLDGHSHGLTGKNCEVFLLHHDDKMIGYRRFDEARPDEDVVVIANLRNTVRSQYPVIMPAPGTWHVHMNSDARAYGPDFDGVGTSLVNASGSPPTAYVNIGRYSMLVLSRQESAAGKTARVNTP